MFRVVPKYLTTAVLSIAIMSAVPGLASAAACSGQVNLGFGDSYRMPDGSTRVHRGLDISASAGDGVQSPVEGTIGFVGRIPGSAGGTVLAVSIDCDEGRVTLTPLERAEVTSGQRVAQGEEIGTLAAAGDPSSEASHLHMSLRSGDLYLDPIGLLTPGGIASEGNSPEMASEAAAEPRPTALGASAMAQGVCLSATARPGATQMTAASAGAALSADGPRVDAATHRVGSSMGEGVELAPMGTPEAPLLSLAGTTDGAHAPAADAPIDSLKRASVTLAHTAARQASAAGPITYLVIVAALLSSVFILSLRAFERRLTSRSPVSDRLGRLLQQLRTGATLRGLTSCPGETAFTVPGPSSPGEVTK